MSKMISSIDLVSYVQHATSMMQTHIEEYHDCDVPENTQEPMELQSLRDIMYHLMGSITPVTGVD